MTNRGGRGIIIPALTKATTRNARVVELVDSLASGASALYGRAGSTPASRTNLIRIRFSYENGFGSFCFFRHPKTAKQGAPVLPPFSLSVLRPRFQRAIEIAGPSAAIHQKGGAGDEPAPVAHEQLRYMGHLVCRCSCGDTLPKGRPDNGPEIMELFEHSGHLVCPLYHIAYSISTRLLSVFAQKSDDMSGNQPKSDRTRPIIRTFGLAPAYNEGLEGRLKG